MNKRGLPIPYIAQAPERLGTTDAGRRVEVARDWLCQVCGERVADPAFAVASTDDSPSAWPREWLLDHGLIHEDCVRIAINACPALIAWDHKRLLRLPLAVVERSTDLQLLVPLSVQEEFEVDVALYRETSHSEA